jgi:hypothetical protein
MYKIALPLALALASLFGTASAHVGPVDPTFGDAGMKSYGFQPVNSSTQHDYASVGCAAADGTFTTTGFASGENRIVTMRLLPNGEYDKSYGFEGRVSVPLSGSYNDFVPGLCQPDGHMVMARATTQPGGEQNLQILRVLKHTGQLDVAGFGSGGLVHVDLDTFFPGQLGTQEMPLGVNALSNGDIAVSGQTEMANGERHGFVVLLASNGAIRAVRVLTLGYEYANTVVEAPAGFSPNPSLWVFGKEYNYAGAYRLTVDRQTLEPGAHTLATYNPSSPIMLGSGRAIDADTVVMPAAVQSNNPFILPSALLFVFHRDRGAFVALGAATLSGSPLEPVRTPGHQAVTVLPGRRVLLAASAKVPGDDRNGGMYLGMARIGRDHAGNRPEPGFVGGVVQAAAVFEPLNPNCFGAGIYHKVSRLTLWLGMPVLVGSVDAICGTADSDYLVARIRPDYIFADGLD